MNFSDSFYRKSIYAVLATLLLLPISFLARPRSIDPQTKSADKGGLISELRVKHNLSQASLSKVDPTSEVMKLGSLGLHGIAVNMLWNQANDLQEKKAFDKVSATLDTLILLQPNFISVWEFQGHNLAYNISREFDDYEDRYFWIKEGLNFFMKGIAFNKRDHRIYDNLGLHTGLKLGKSDEKKQFREIFRSDDTYMNNQVGNFVDPDSFNRVASGGYDNWLWAYQWYDKSYYMREKLNVPQRTSDLMYWMKRESQLRNFADGLAQDFRPDAASQQAWKDAFEAWLIYGRREIRTTFGEVITHESLQAQADAVEEAKRKLDELAPGVRERLLNERLAKLNEKQLAVYKKTADERTFAESVIFGEFSDSVKVTEREVAYEAPPENKGKAEELLLDMAESMFRLEQIDNYRSTVNYEFWRNFCEMESTKPAVEARQAMYDANLKKSQGVYEDYTEQVEGEDGQLVTVTQPGAISLMEKAFKGFAVAFEPFPYLRMNESTMMDDMFADMESYNQYLELNGRPWPDDFPLQDLVDRRARMANNDNLPTSDDIKAMKLELGELDAPGDPAKPEAKNDEQSSDGPEATPEKESSEAEAATNAGLEDDKSSALPAKSSDETAGDLVEPASDAPPKPQSDGSR